MYFFFSTILTNRQMFLYFHSLFLLFSVVSPFSLYIVPFWIFNFFLFNLSLSSCCLCFLRCVFYFLLFTRTMAKPDSFCCCCFFFSVSSSSLVFSSLLLSLSRFLPHCLYSSGICFSVLSLSGKERCEDVLASFKKIISLSPLPYLCYCHFRDFYPTFCFHLVFVSLFVSIGQRALWRCTSFL